MGTLHQVGGEKGTGAGYSCCSFLDGLPAPFRALQLATGRMIRDWPAECLRLLRLGPAGSATALESFVECSLFGCLWGPCVPVPSKRHRAQPAQRTVNLFAHAFGKGQGQS